MVQIMQGVFSARVRLRPAQIARSFQQLDVGSAVLWVYPLILFLSDWVLTISIPNGLILHAVLVLALACHYVLLTPRTRAGLLLPTLTLLSLTRLMSAVFDSRTIPNDLLPLTAVMPLLLVLTSVGIILLLRASRGERETNRFAKLGFTFARFDPQVSRHGFWPGSLSAQLASARRFILNASIQIFIALSGIAIGCLIAMIYRALDIHALGIAGHSVSVMRLDNNGLPAPSFIAGLVLLAVVEELVFRGLILSGARNMLGRGGIAFASAVWMAASMGFVSPIYLLIAFALGVFWGMAAEWSGSLAGVLLAHVLANVVIGLWPAMNNGMWPRVFAMLPYAMLGSALMGVLVTLYLAWRPRDSVDDVNDARAVYGA